MIFDGLTPKDMAIVTETFLKAFGIEVKNKKKFKKIVEKCIKFVEKKEDEHIKETREAEPEVIEQTIDFLKKFQEMMDGEKKENKNKEGDNNE